MKHRKHHQDNVKDEKPVSRSKVLWAKTLDLETPSTWAKTQKTFLIMKSLDLVDRLHIGSQWQGGHQLKMSIDILTSRCPLTHLHQTPTPTEFPELTFYPWMQNILKYCLKDIFSIVFSLSLPTVMCLENSIRLVKSSFTFFNFNLFY